MVAATCVDKCFHLKFTRWTPNPASRIQGFYNAFSINFRLLHLRESNTIILTVTEAGGMNWSKLHCEPKSFLSEIVFEIVCEAGHFAETDDSSLEPAAVTAACCLNTDGILNWDLLGTYLPGKCVWLFQFIPFIFVMVLLNLQAMWENCKNSECQCFCTMNSYCVVYTMTWSAFQGNYILRISFSHFLLLCYLCTLSLN